MCELIQLDGAQHPLDALVNHGHTQAHGRAQLIPQRTLEDHALCEGEVACHGVDPADPVDEPALDPVDISVPGPFEAAVEGDKRGVEGVSVEGYFHGAGGACGAMLDVGYSTFDLRPSTFDLRPSTLGDGR